MLYLNIQNYDIYKEYSSGPMKGVLASMGLTAYGIRNPIYKIKSSDKIQPSNSITLQAGPQPYLVNIYDAPKTKPVFQEAPTFIEPLPLKKLPVVSQPGLVPYVLPKQSTVKSTPIYQASQAHRTGQYQIGNNVWNEDKKKWERKLFKDSEERDWYYNQCKIKKQHGGLTKYQGDKEPSEVNTSDVVPNTTPAYERVVVTDPNDPNYLEYQKLKRLYDWSNLDTDYKNDTLWRYLSLDEENKDPLIDYDYQLFQNPKTNLEYRNAHFTEDQGYYGSPNTIGTFKSKAELEKFLKRNKKNLNDVYIRAQDEESELKQYENKYPPVSYQYHSYYPFPGYLYTYGTIPKSKSSRTIWTTPNNAIIENEINNQNIKKIYPRYTDEQIKEDYERKILSPSYITNHIDEYGDLDYIHPKDNISKFPLLIKENNLVGYLPESVIEDNDLSYEAFPIFGTPESYLGKTYVYEPKEEEKRKIYFEKIESKKILDFIRTPLKEKNKTFISSLIVD